MIDLQLDNTLDLVEDEHTGDWVEGPADEQHQELLLVTKKGAWKENPLTGVGLIEYLMDNDVNGMLREVRRQFEADKMTVNSVGFDEVTGNLKFDAAY